MSSKGIEFKCKCGTLCDAIMTKKKARYYTHTWRCGNCDRMYLDEIFRKKKKVPAMIPDAHLGVKLTLELVQDGFAVNGGCNYRQMEILGEWPAIKGWKERCVGKIISQQDYSLYLELKGQKSKRPQKKTRSKRVEERQERIESVNYIHPVKKYKSPVVGPFYKSKEWRALRYGVIEKHKGQCCACGRTRSKHGVVMHVDHIEPRSKRPDLELDIDNLQLLCDDCNLGKMADYATDWR